MKAAATTGSRRPATRFREVFEVWCECEEVREFQRKLESGPDLARIVDIIRMRHRFWRRAIRLSVRVQCSTVSKPTNGFETNQHIILWLQHGVFAVQSRANC